MGPERGFGILENISGPKALLSGREIWGNAVSTPFWGHGGMADSSMRTSL